MQRFGTGLAAVEALQSLIVRGQLRLPHDALFELDWRSCLALIITFVGSALASSAGIGGGALFVPMFHVLLGFGMKTSTALSQTVIMGGAVASMLINAFKSCPTDVTRPLIDFRLVLVFMPVLLTGVNIGVLLNTMFPEWLLTLLLVALILYLTVAALKKGTSLWHSEVQAKLARQTLQHHLAVTSAAVPQHDQDSVKLPISTNTKVLVTLPASSGHLPDFVVADGAGEREEYVGQGEEAGGKAWGALSGWIPAARRSRSGIGIETGTSPELQEPQLLCHYPNHDGEVSIDTPCHSSQDVEVMVPAREISHSMEPHMPNHFRPHPISNALKRPFLGGNSHAKPVVRTVCCGPTTSMQTGQLVVLWALFSALQLFKSQAPRCSAPFWCLCLSQWGAMAAAVLLFSWQTMRQQQQGWSGLQGLVAVEAGVIELQALLPKSESPAPFSPSFTLSSLVLAQLITFVAGLAGGLLGIGGGMVMSPLLLELGTEPLVAAATVSLMVLFSSSTAVFQFAAMARLNPHFSVVFSMDGLVASLLGVMVVNHAVRRSGRASIVVFILAAVVATGGLTAGIFGAMQGWRDFQSGTHIGFTSICSTVKP